MGCQLGMCMRPRRGTVLMCGKPEVVVEGTRVLREQQCRDGSGACEEWLHADEGMCCREERAGGGRTWGERAGGDGEKGV